MSLSATAWLAADAALPQRDALLDTGLMAGRIGRLIGTADSLHIDRCDRLRVNYQIGKSLRVVYRIGVGNTHMTICARACRDGRSHRLYHDAREAARQSASLWSPAEAGHYRPVFHDAELDTVFWVFPNDRKITALGAVVNGDLSGRDELPLVWRSTQLMAYAPEKSATLACLDDDGAVIAYAKVSASDQAEHDVQRSRALQQAAEGNPHLRLPRTRAYLPRYRLVITEAIHGRRMDEPTGPHAVQDAARFGAALAAFHALAPCEAPPLTRFEPDRLREARRLVVSVRPDVADPVGALVSELIARRPSDEDAPVCLHGDVHPKNAIVTDRDVALIDVEDLALGPAAADLGSFLASLLYLRRGARLPARTHHDVVRAFLLGYEFVRPLPARAALIWHISAALFIERILRAVTRVRPLGLCHLPELIAEARELLRDGEDDFQPRAVS
jgi:Ser/Thr protein kinase RdoA (MazF antagonist)